MYVSAIVLAAGLGLRFESRVPKPLIRLNSQPIIIYSLNVLSKHPYIRDIIVVVNALNRQGIQNCLKKYAIAKIKAVILGGKERRDSVRNGLSATDKRTDLVLIHDAARPFIDRDLVSCVISEAKKTGAAILGVPVKATIKEANSLRLKSKNKIIVKETLDRENLWEIQTPQVFKKDLILEAYKKYSKLPATDDSMLVEKSGIKVKVVKGSCFNIKITTPEDLVIAEAIAKSLMTNDKIQSTK